jgi:hypothetical protein
MPADLTNPDRCSGYRFPVSLPTAQEPFRETGSTVGHETLRERHLTFAGLISLEIQRRRTAPSWMTCVLVSRAGNVAVASGGWAETSCCSKGAIRVF